MEQPEYISLVMAAYNSSQWMQRAIDSVLAAADKDCELVIVDDGSTDDTLAIAKEYEDKDPRVVVVEIPHQGVSAARKAGVANCSGDSVIFVDTDDVMAPTAIEDFRKFSGPDIDIVTCNVVRKPVRGKSTLSVSGHLREMTPHDYLRQIMGLGHDVTLHGKKFRRTLFNVYFWDTDPILVGIYHRALLLQLISACKGKVIVEPNATVYTYIRRPESLSQMINLRPQGIARLWESLEKTPLPLQEYVNWGLDLLDETIFSRGLPIPDDYAPARAMIEHAKGLDLDEKRQRILRLLKDKNFRLRESQRLVREGLLTTETPHLSFIVVSYNNFNDVKRTVESILNSGFRNIEVIVVDDGSNWQESVKINAYTMKYPRVHLRKHNAHRGLAAARRTGIENVHGVATMFINAGDTIVPEGVLDGLTLLDSTGVDVIIMGAKINPKFSDFNTDTFVPSKATRIKKGKEHTIAGLLEKVELPLSVCYGMSLTSTLKRTPFDFETDDYSCDAMWLISFYMQGVNHATTDAIGYYQHRSPGKDLKPFDRCLAEIRGAELTLDMLEKFGKCTDENKQGVAKGVIATVCRTTANIIRGSIFGKIRARRMLSDLLEQNSLYQLFERTGTLVPTLDDLMTDALSLTKKD